MKLKEVIEMVQVTPAALTEVKKAISQHQDEMQDVFVRLHMSIGWGGPQLKLALEESAGEEDQITEVDGVKFIVASKANAYFNNTKVDYVKTIFGGGEFKLITV